MAYGPIKDSQWKEKAFQSVQVLLGTQPYTLKESVMHVTGTMDIKWMNVFIHDITFLS